MVVGGGGVLGGVGVVRLLDCLFSLEVGDGDGDGSVSSSTSFFFSATL